MEEEQPHDFPPPDDPVPSWKTDFGQNSFAAPEPPPFEPPAEPLPPAAEGPLFLSDDAAAPPPIPPPADTGSGTAATTTPKPEHKSRSLPGWLKGMSPGSLLKWVLGLALLGWLYSNCHPDLPTGLLAEHYTFPESKFIPVEGMDVHYRIVGRGEPILLLHDANSSMHTWAGWTAELASKYQLISVDLPGFGLTGPHPQGSYSTFMYHAFLDSLVHQLHLGKFHLAGNGLGAEIAWFYAAEHPAGLDKLILLDAPGLEHSSTGGGWVDWLARTPVLNRVLWSVTPRSYVRLMLEDIYADDTQVTDSLVQRHFDLLLAPGNRHAFTDRASVSDNRPPAGLTDSISTPTLILWGAEDTRISPEHAYEFHQRIRGALLRIYQNTGHWPQEENPVKTARDVEAFLEGKF